MHLCLPPKILQNHRFQFLLGNTVVIREVEDNGHIIFGGRGRGEREGGGGKEGALWYMWKWWIEEYLAAGPSEIGEI